MILAAGKLLPCKNLGEIRSRIPARFWLSGLLLPGKNLGKICGRIPARFWPQGILIPPGFLLGIKIPAAKIWPGSRQDSCQDPGPYFTRGKSYFHSIIFIKMHLQWEKLPTSMSYLLTRDSTVFPAYWILIGQFKFQEHQPYALLNDSD